jgi:glycosyltransferase involved in cell wall biosynthesis
MALFIGRMTGHKGYRELVLAVRRLRQEGKEITLVLIGLAGKDAKRFLKAHGGEGVVFLGQAGDEEKNDAFFACDLFCLPSKSEILPLTILEAWWAGKPVLAGDIPALRAFVHEGEDGLFVKQDADAVREALLQFISVPGRFGHLGENGRKKVEERYLIQHVAEQTRNLYIEVMQRKKDVTRLTQGTHDSMGLQPGGSKERPVLPDLEEK